MHTTTLISFILLGSTAIIAAPVHRFRSLARREDAPVPVTSEFNDVRLSTDIKQTCTNFGFIDENTTNSTYTSFLVNGLEVRNINLARQIACLTDETVCLQQGNTTAACNNKRQFCELSGSDSAKNLGDRVPLNEDGDRSETQNSFDGTTDPKCQQKEHPLLCVEGPVNPDPESAEGFRPLEGKSSKFIEDNDAGATLTGTKAGPIGKGFKSTVVDNGNGTFTAGNLTTYSMNFALQLGCIFDEAECIKTTSRDECTTKLVECERTNGLIRKSVVIAQRPTGTVTLPEGVPTEVENPAF